MSIEGLFDHTGTIRRPTATTDATDALADEVTTYPVVAAAVRFALVPPKLRLRDYGAGELPAGSMEFYAGAAAPLQRFDVLVVDTGPEAGTVWKIESVRRPRGHHTEGVASPRDEPLPAEAPVP